MESSERPVEAVSEMLRSLRPAAPFVVWYSTRGFPTKAVFIWQRLGGPDQQRLVGAYMRAAGFSQIAEREHRPPDGDPLWCVIGKA